MLKILSTLFVTLLIALFSITFECHAQSTTENPEVTEKTNVKHLSNNSRLVITNVVKTVEFEVGVLEDDGTLDDNLTDTNSTGFFEADINVLNLDLLKEVVNQAEEKLNQTETKNLKEENVTKSDETKR